MKICRATFSRLVCLVRWHDEDKCTWAAGGPIRVLSRCRRCDKLLRDDFAGLPTWERRRLFSIMHLSDDGRPLPYM